MAKQSRPLPGKSHLLPFEEEVSLKKPRRSRGKKSPAQAEPTPAAQPTADQRGLVPVESSERGKNSRQGPPPGVFEFVQFGDLHVNRQTAERCCRVLRQVGELARARNATVVCTGDFWDLRGTLDVRLVDAVLFEVERMERLILVPGNHDQVTLDGLIHGMNVFRGLPNVTVVTKPIYDAESRIAFLPWRELPEAQRALFDMNAVAEALAREIEQPMPTEGWTIFGHAEVEGALMNSGRRTRGHVPIALIERHARACYLSHYHVRQRLGDRTWYIGSPFELNAGERNQPHGVAIIRTDRVEPEFVELAGFPRHHRMSLEDVEAGLADGQVEAGDVVELVADSDDIGTERYRRAEQRLPTESVRPRTAEADDSSSDVPSFALAFDAALELVTRETPDPPAPVEQLLAYGRDVLSRLPEARRIPALGRSVDLVSLQITDFCALRGTLDVPIAEGRTLLVGPIKSGKTAVIDAIMWCLYGATTPRKAGASATSATLRADEVIHDVAQSCSVSVGLEVDGRHVVITRSKRRGAGGRVEIRGVMEPDGISDQQQLIDSIVGLPHALWRACVSLGQGAVSTFATDADKKRKELLSSAFGLDVCPAAQKAARARRDAAKSRIEEILHKAVDARARIDVLARIDVAQQSREWEERRAVSLAALTERGTQLNATIADCVRALEAEPSWLESRSAHNARVDHLTRQLAQLRPAARLAALQREYGAIESELALAERALTQARERHGRLVATGASNCETCGQPLPAVQREQHLHAAEVEVKNAQSARDTQEHRKVNAAAQLDALNTGGAEQQQAVEQAIAESRRALQKCGDALNQFTRVRANHDNAVREVERARAEYKAQSEHKNPFDEQARQNAEQLGTLRSHLSALEQESAAAALELALAEFWVEAFGPKGIPVVVLRTALYDLEVAANRYIARLLDGTVFVRLSMDEDDLQISYFEICPDGEKRPRVYEQLSGGQRRCVEVAFAPLALSDLVFARTGVHIGFLAFDELTTHLGAEEKSVICAILEQVDRRSVLVVDHDPSVQGYFGTRLVLGRDAAGNSQLRAA